jgi:hypothetical protein
VRFTFIPGIPANWQVATETVANSGIFNNVLVQQTQTPNGSPAITPNGTVATITFNSRGRAVMGGGDFYTITRDGTPAYRYTSCILFSTNGRPTIVRHTDSPADVCL